MNEYVFELLVHQRKLCGRRISLTYAMQTCKKTLRLVQCQY